MNHRPLSHASRRTAAAAAVAAAIAAAIAAGLALASPLMAQTTAAPARPAAAQGVEMAEGVVRHVDREAGRITLRHGEIKSINMPPMTMVFHLRDRALLDGIAAGAKVRFAVVAEDGKHVITQLQAEP